ncbi:MAG: hypothetical protein J0H74_03320 [Chitinophagaceae bacterium]|nr:hypothetical protein [Chitinophagaceae bacterium]
MKRLKLIDHCLQTLLLAYFVRCCCIDIEHLLIAYRLVLGGNALSCLVHVILDCRQIKGARRDIFQKILLVIMVVGIGGVFSLVYLYILSLFLVWILPFLAVFYWWISLRETVSLFETKKITDHESL